MPSTGMLPRATFVKTEFSEEYIASIFSITRLDEIGTTLATQARCAARMEAIPSSENSGLTRATLRNIPEDYILRRVIKLRCPGM
jgi:hypothetical protein